MEIYTNCYYKTFIRKNKKNKGYIGFIGKKVAFLPRNFMLPSYLTEGNYDILGKYIEDKGNYFIIKKIELPSMYDVIGIPKNAFKNSNTTTTILENDIPVKISKNYIAFEINNNKCRISLFQRLGNRKDVDMTLINVNGHLNILNDLNPFFKNGKMDKTDINEIVKILSSNYNSDIILYLISEFMWLDEELYQELYQKISKKENTKKENRKNNINETKNIIKQLSSIYAYGNWDIGTYNLNIPVVNKELYKIIK